MQPKPNDPECTELSKLTTYAVDGREFIVEPFFKEEASETLGEILLKLIKNDIGIGE